MRFMFFWKVEAESISQARLDEEKELKDQETVLSKAEAQFDADQSRHRTLKQQTTGTHTHAHTSR